VREAEESPPLKAVAKERLLKEQKDVVICKMWRLAIML
jgi:hypothetical protein